MAEIAQGPKKVSALDSDFGTPTPAAAPKAPAAKSALDSDFGSNFTQAPQSQSAPTGVATEPSTTSVSPSPASAQPTAAALQPDQLPEVDPFANVPKIGALNVDAIAKAGAQLRGETPPQGIDPTAATNDQLQQNADAVKAQQQIAANDQNPAQTAAVKQVVQQQQQRQVAAAQTPVVPPDGAGTFTQFAAADQGQDDPRAAQLRSDYTQYVNNQPDFGVHKNESEFTTESLKDHSATSLDKFGQFEVNALNFAQEKLNGRTERYNQMLAQGADPASLQAEAQDINDGQQYLRGRYAYLVHNMPKSDLQKLIDQRQAETNAYQPGLLGTIRQGERQVAGGFSSSLLGTVSGLARGLAQVTNTGEGYSWEDKLGETLDGVLRKDQAYLPSDWQEPMIQTLPDGSKKYNILPTLLSGAGAMLALVGEGNLGALGGRALGTAAKEGIGLAAEGMQANAISGSAGVINNMAASLPQLGQSAGLSASMYFPMYDGYVKQAMAQGVPEDMAQKAGNYYAIFAALSQNINPQLYLMNPELKTTIKDAFLDAVKKGALSPKEMTAFALKTIGKEGGRQAIENMVQSAGEKATNYVVNGLTGSNLDSKMTVDGGITDIATGFVLGGIASAFHAPTAVRENMENSAEAMRFAAENPEVVNHMITLEVPKEQQEKYRERVKQLVSIYKGNGLSDLPTKNAAQVANTLEQKRSVEQGIKDSPMDPTLESVNGDPRKNEVAALTLQSMEAMGIKADDAVLALAGQGMLVIPEGAKIAKGADGKVTVEVNPAKDGEESLTKEAVIEDLKKQADAIRPPGKAPEPIADKPAETPASAEVKPPETAPIAPSNDRVEPNLTKDVPDDQASLAGAYLDAQEAHTNESNPENVIYSLAKGGVKRQSYIDFSDKNNITDGFAKHYFSKKGSGIDQIAKEASDITGREVTPQDVVEAMNNNPEGWPMRSERMAELDDRHKALYGKKLNSLTAKKVLREAKDKPVDYTPEEKAIVEHAKDEGVPIDEISDKDIENFDNLSDEDADIMFGGGSTISKTGIKDAGSRKEQVQQGTTGQDASTVRSAESQGTNGAGEKAAAEVTPPTSPTDTPPAEGSGKVVNKTFVHDRVYEGAFRDEVKAELEKLGLTREVENQDKAEQSAKDLIGKIGIDAATDAVRNHDVSGGAGAVVWHEALRAIENQIILETNPTKLAELWAKQAGMAEEIGQQQLDYGRFNSMFAKINAQSDLGFSTAHRISDWEKKFAGTKNPKPSEEMVAKWREQEKQIADLNKKLADAEKVKDEAVHDATMAALKAATTRYRSNEKNKTYTQRSKEFADKVRKLKNNPIIFRDADGKPIDVTKAGIDWNDIVETAAKAIEAAGKGVDAVAAAMTALSKKFDREEWFQNLNDRDRKAVLKQVEDHLNQSNEGDVGGKLKIPKSMIRDAVENGAKDIHELTATIKEAIKDEHPDATTREVMDAITEYGKVVNMSKDDISVQIRRMKDIGRTLSAIEDVENKKRPLKSGLQRDKLDAEQRDLHKKLRELMKDLPVDDATSNQQLKTALDAAKSRARNRIEDLQREIDTRQKTKRSTTEVKPDTELKALIAERDRLQGEHDKIFGEKGLSDEERMQAALRTARASEERYKKLVRDNLPDPAKPAPVKETPELKAARADRDRAKAEYTKLQEDAGVFEKRRQETSEKAIQAQIDALKKRIRDKDYSKKEKKAPVVSDDITKLRAEKLRIKDEYDTDFYKNEQANRSAARVVWDTMGKVYDMTRIFQATFDLSFIGLQGGKLTISNLYHKPEAVGRSFKAMWKGMMSKEYTDQWLREVKSQDWYPAAKEAGLKITDPNGQTRAAEELYASNYAKLVWDTLGQPSRLLGKKAYERWKLADPFKSLERGASMYLDALRVERWQDGLEVLKSKEAEGKDITKQDYKDVADVINTMTGRAGLGKLEASSTILTKVFFSPRLWASAIKTGTPYAFYYVGRQTPTARKMILMDMSRHIGTTLGMVMMAAAYYNNDGDPNTGVEMDPRSSDFMKLKIGRTRIDPWGGMSQQIVMMTRITIGAKSLVLNKPYNAYKNSKGELMPLGIHDQSPTMGEVATQMALNKLAPSASLIAGAVNSELKSDGTRKTSYGDPYVLSHEMISKVIPIYTSTIQDILQDDSKGDNNSLKGFELLYGLVGGGVQTYKKPKTRQQKREAARKAAQATRIYKSSHHE